MLTQSFAEALAEAERIITSASHVQSEADLAEGYDYLAGNIRGSLQLAWAYQRDFPYFVSSTGPYTKLGLDNPDALYFHSYLRDDAEYVITGRRGTTTDLSFQILNGDYSPVDVPDSLSAFDDWDTERRGTLSIHRADRAGHAPEVAGTAAMGKRYTVAGKILLSRLRTFLAFPQWFYLELPVNRLTEPRRTPGGLASQFSSAGHYELGA